MGELYTNPAEYVHLIQDRLIDFLRMHISCIGGLTPARKVAALAEFAGVRTAWHGPGDVSPVGHAANVHLDLATPNFGIQEWTAPGQALREVFPGRRRSATGWRIRRPVPDSASISTRPAARYPFPDRSQRLLAPRAALGWKHRPALSSPRWPASGGRWRDCSAPR